MVVVVVVAAEEEEVVVVAVVVVAVVVVAVVGAAAVAEEEEVVVVVVVVEVSMVHVNPHHNPQACFLISELQGFQNLLPLGNPGLPRSEPSVVLLLRDTA